MSKDSPEDPVRVTEILQRLAAGDGDKTELVEAVYDELKGIARARIGRERRDHTLQPTALVNEAYLRLFGRDATPEFENRAHFFGAAAEAMRRILVDNARKRRRPKHGGDHDRRPLLEDHLAVESPTDGVEAISVALEKLESADSRAALIVKLRYFVGLTIDETAAALGVSSSTVRGDWTISKAWLSHELRNVGKNGGRTHGR